MVGTGDLTVSADAVGADHGGDHVPADELDVPDGAVALLGLFQNQGSDPWTMADAHDLALNSTNSEDDTPHIKYRTIRRYLKALADAGALEKTEGDAPTDPNEYRLR